MDGIPARKPVAGWVGDDSEGLGEDRGLPGLKSETWGTQFSWENSRPETWATSPSSYGTIYSYEAGYAPNGNIITHSDSVMGSWNFEYDAVDRLVVAQNTMPDPARRYANDYLCWNYDAFGNRLSESVSTTPGTCNPSQASWANYNTANNQMTSSSYATGGVIYDAAGNTLFDGRNQYWYDGEGQLCAVRNLTSGNMTQYVYDAEGARIAEGSLSASPGAYSIIGPNLATSPTCAAPQASGTTLANSASTLSLSKRFLVDLGGEQVTEMNEGGSESWSHSNIFAGSRLTATYDTSGLHYELADPLGTKRVQTNILGKIEETCVSLPFGNDLNNPVTASCSQPQGAPATSDDATEHHFTSKERDTESGNDYFGARYYASSIGRFLTPDWSTEEDAVPFAKSDDPQSLNLYGYVRNNPLTSIDPKGHAPLCVGFWCFVGAITQAEKELFAQEAKAQAQKRTEDEAQRKADRQKSHAPDHLVMLRQTKYPRKEAVVEYQVVDRRGRPAAASGSLAEHIDEVTDRHGDAVKLRIASDIQIGKDSTFLDIIGPDTPNDQEPEGVYYSFKTVQTFTVWDGRNTFTLTTKVQQFVQVQDGVVTQAGARILVP